MASYESKDATLPSTIHPLLLKKHVEFLVGYTPANNPYEYAVTEHLRMNGMFWSLTALDLMGALDQMDREAIVTFVRDCQHRNPPAPFAELEASEALRSRTVDASHATAAAAASLPSQALPNAPDTNTGVGSDATPSTDARTNAAQEAARQKYVKQLVAASASQRGGFGASIGHDAHVLSTLSAVQILCLFDRLDAIDEEATVAFVASLQQPDGSFVGDVWGEVDTRFSLCAMACLSLLGRLDAIDVQAAVRFIQSTANFDGGFGRVPGSESHASQVYVCLGALTIAGAVDACVDRDQLGWWLAERQLPKSGGLNGRPEKLPDVCYSWWVLSSMCMLDRLQWIDAERLAKFILACQDDVAGGIADRPDDMSDPYHTVFGLAGLSLLARLGAPDAKVQSDQEGVVGVSAGLAIKPVNSVYCLPQDVIDRVMQRNKDRRK
ncbi:RAB geranylgeranyl transferase b subunit [Capsaspora owczarzaki ATCC 30864]|uniref:RAB geranylgeranyl transferase b subunit n=1 Tax=Capsaspora owczarzaki (strain ATCC 30864) TaxID=595528 RepID=UPI0003526227|nr:RAB geranylgeranyl transferase b subunit [Capsaspora owczarzaki ATCC 30864]|eukprot:XP_004365312.2 RAB geranylgeranyl transferase b subunit [Capsaspora owczarzaki ATCC 30864]